MGQATFSIRLEFAAPFRRLEGSLDVDWCVKDSLYTHVFLPTEHSISINVLTVCFLLNVQGEVMNEGKSELADL